MSRYVALKPRKIRGELVCLNEDLEQMFGEIDLEEIAQMWNDGKSEYEIAKVFKCDPDEIFLALFHLARRDKLKRPYGKRLG